MYAYIYSVSIHAFEFISLQLSCRRCFLRSPGNLLQPAADACFSWWVSLKRINSRKTKMRGPLSLSLATGAEKNIGVQEETNLQRGAGGRRYMCICVPFGGIYMHIFSFM